MSKCLQAWYPRHWLHPPSPAINHSGLTIHSDPISSQSLIMSRSSPRLSLQLCEVWLVYHSRTPFPMLPWVLSVPVLALSLPVFNLRWAVSQTLEIHARLHGIHPKWFLDGCYFEVLVAAKTHNALGVYGWQFYHSIAVYSESTSNKYVIKHSIKVHH